MAYTGKIRVLLITLFICFAGAAKVHATAYSIDLTAGSGDQVNIGGVIFAQGQVGAGSGVYTRLFAIQNTGVEQGYNYDGAGTLPFDGKTGSFNPQLDLGLVPVVTIAGIKYLNFTIDLNQSASTITLTDFRFYVESDPSNTNTALPKVTSTANLDSTLAASGTGVKVYSFGSNTLLMNNVPSGSGASDYTINIPMSWVMGSGTGDNVYVFIAYTGADSGFEELAIDKGITSNFGNSQTPEPGTVWGGLSIAAVLGGGGYFKRRKKQDPES